jgi:hypothetical protein
MLLWEIVDQNEVSSRIRRSNKYASTSHDFYETRMRCGLIQKFLKNSVEFRRREVVNNDFSATSSFLDYDFGA